MIGALVLSGVTLSTPMAFAADDGIITSAGPLSSISTSGDLNCAVNHVGDFSPEFYGVTACATLVAVGGTLYGPSNIPAGGAAARTPFTLVSQAGPVGAGTSADPFRVTTVVDLGSTGVRLTQTDTYVTGRESYTTNVSLTNSGAADLDALVYRAADCYLANSDFGLGKVTDNAVACVADGGRVEQWVPLTGGSTYMEGGYSEVWARTSTQQPFPNSCRCTEHIDNGAGLSWPLHLTPNGTGRVAHLTAFSPSEAPEDRDQDGLPDSWEINGYDTNGDGVPEVDLPAMGASPDHKDLFVEVDWMVKPRTCFLWIICSNSRNFAPQQSAMNDVVTAFANAPMTNPDGQSGIRLHIDSGPNSVMNPVTHATWGERSQAGQVPYQATLGRSGSKDFDWSGFNAIKASNFQATRADVFHYAIFGDRQAGSDSSGVAQVTKSRFNGDSFLVTSGAASSGFSVRQESGTFMHEFGHTLGLHHGGGGADEGADLNNKPNYLSVMNYSWQMGGRGLDYSRSELPALDERSLNENDGYTGTTDKIAWFCPIGNDEFRRVDHVAGPRLDWNCNGAISGTSSGLDVSADETQSELRGHNDWPGLIFDGGAVGAFGASDLDDQLPPPETTPSDEPSLSALEKMGSAGGDGDGALQFVGPSVLLAGVSGQKLAVDVTNVGNVTASYTVSVAGLPPTTISVASHQQGRAEIPVDTTGWTPGTRTFTANLTAAGAQQVLASDQLEVTVPDLTDPQVRAQAEAALGQIGGPVDGLDDAVRQSLVTSLGSALATKPGAPTGVTATAGDRQAMVTWTPPAQTGSGPITAYVVTAQPGGKVVEVGGNQATATVTGLTNGTAYTFTVAARNASGLGAASIASAPVTPAAPTTDQLSVSVTGGVIWQAAGAAPKTAFTTGVDKKGALTKVTGTATVPGGGSTYRVKIDLHRINGVLPLIGQVTIVEAATGKTAYAIAPWPQQATAIRQPDGSLAISMVLPGLVMTPKLKPVRITLALTDR
ncbi:fibronectin type III domain-containing protein [Amycolatopsis sp. NPDC004772]